jgi:cytoskeletal protein CcmA (bactofilin family)
MSQLQRNQPAPQRHIHSHARRRASMYAIVMATTVLITVMGFMALTVRRIDGRRYDAGRDVSEARLLARSALELGLTWISVDTSWRAHIGQTAWNTDLPVGKGFVRIAVSDPSDSDLTDSDADPVLIQGTGTRGSARQVMELSLTTTIKPMDVLRACLHSDSTTTIQALKTLSVSGGTLWTNTLSNSGVIFGNVEATTVSRRGVVFGSVTSPAAHTDPNFDDIWAYYLAKATTLGSTGNWNKVALGPGYNPWGTANVDGVYYIKTNNSDLTIKASRLYGTLLLDVGSKEVRFEDDVLFQAYRSDYPVLLIKGDVDMRIKSSTSLSENSNSTNYNRAGVPYGGVTDNDKTDSYPVEIDGLIHMKGNITIKESVTIKGALLISGAVTIDASPQFTQDPAILSNPPLGYRLYYYPPVAGGWRRTVE